MSDPQINYMFTVNNVPSYYTDTFKTLESGVPLGIKANTAFINVSSDFILITSANTYTKSGDRVYYEVANSQTAIGGLTANSFYYVKTANTSGMASRDAPSTERPRAPRPAKPGRAPARWPNWRGRSHSAPDQPPAR